MTLWGEVGILRLAIMVRIESLSTQPQLGIGQSFDRQPFFKNGEKPLAGKVALVTNITRGVGAEIAIALAQEGVQIMGVVGINDSREEAKKDAIHIDYNGGWMDLVSANLNTSEGREKVRTRVGEVDILVFPSLVTEGNNTLIDGFLPYIREGGKIVLVGREDEAMESLREGLRVNAEFHKKGISFFVVSPVERIEEIGKKVAEILKRSFWN